MGIIQFRTEPIAPTTRAMTLLGCWPRRSELHSAHVVVVCHRSPSVIVTNCITTDRKGRDAIPALSVGTIPFPVMAEAQGEILLCENHQTMLFDALAGFF